MEYLVHLQSRTREETTMSMWASHPSVLKIKIRLYMKMEGFNSGRAWDDEGNEAFEGIRIRVNKKWNEGKR